MPDDATGRIAVAETARARQEPSLVETACMERMAAVARASQADEAAAWASAFVRGEIAHSGGRQSQPA